MRFLRLVWEVSVVHSDGFYLQVEDLDLQMFDQGPADLMLLVRFGTEGSIVPATAYQNSLVGLAPEDGKAIFSTVASDAAGTPVEAWAAAYPGGSVGWSITWENAPDEADASSDRFLEGLYQMVSYRVEKINGQPIDPTQLEPSGDSSGRVSRARRQDYLDVPKGVRDRTRDRLATTATRTLTTPLPCVSLSKTSSATRCLSQCSPPWI